MVTYINVLKLLKKNWRDVDVGWLNVHMKNNDRP